eukprot:scaffold2963_cov341-Prasinococcus_capsulatus_cf.AAC.1
MPVASMWRCGRSESVSAFASRAPILHPPAGPADKANLLPPGHARRARIGGDHARSPIRNLGHPELCGRKGRAGGNPWHQRPYPDQAGARPPWPGRAARAGHAKGAPKRPRSGPFGGPREAWGGRGGGRSRRRPREGDAREGRDGRGPVPV